MANRSRPTTVQLRPNSYLRQNEGVLLLLLMMLSCRERRKGMATLDWCCPLAYAAARGLWLIDAQLLLTTAHSHASTGPDRSSAFKGLPCSALQRSCRADPTERQRLRRCNLASNERLETHRPESIMIFIRIAPVWGSPSSQCTTSPANSVSRLSTPLHPPRIGDPVQALPSWFQ